MLLARLNFLLLTNVVLSTAESGINGTEADATRPKNSEGSRSPRILPPGIRKGSRSPRMRPMSLTQVSVTEHGALHDEAVAHEVRSKTSRSMTPCYALPCVWNKAHAKDKHSGYYSAPKQLYVKTPGAHGGMSSGMSPPPCPYGLEREWASCNDGTMELDGCRGYCPEDNMPGYVSLLSPDMQPGGEEAFAVRLVTKGELDLLREQMERKWMTMYKAIEASLHASFLEVSKVHDETDHEDLDNHNILSKVQRATELSGLQADVLSKSLDKLKNHVLDAFETISAQGQRSMVAALHGVAGMCCCQYKEAQASGPRPLKCDWQTFEGDIDPGSVKLFRNLHRQKKDATNTAGKGVYTSGNDDGTSGEEPIHCGVNERGEPLLAFPTVFASKSQFDGLQKNGAWNIKRDGHEKAGGAGPYYVESVAALDMCAKSDNWKTYTTHKIPKGQNLDKIPAESKTILSVGELEEFEFPPFTDDSLNAYGASSEDVAKSSFKVLTDTAGLRLPSKLKETSKKWLGVTKALEEDIKLESTDLDFGGSEVASSSLAERGPNASSTTEL